MDELQVKALLAAVEDGDIKSLQRIRKEFGAIAVLNSERQALQIEGCDAGALVSHVPLTHDQLAAWLASE